MLRWRTVSLRSLYVLPTNILSSCPNQHDAVRGTEYGEILRSDFALARSKRDVPRDRCHLGMLKSGAGDVRAA